MNKRMLSILLICTFLFTGCTTNTGKVEQKNDSFTAYLLSVADSDWYIKAKDLFSENNPDIPIQVLSLPAEAYELRWSRENRDTSIERLQDYYDKIIDELRTGNSPDLIMGDTLYIDWPEATPPDWEKLVRNGAFADIDTSVEKEDSGMILYAESRASESMYNGENWCIMPITYDTLSFYAKKSLAEKWNFNLPEKEDPQNWQDDVTILEFLELCADWVKEHGNDEGAPMLMPDYEYRRLKSVIFDVCGIKVTDYETGKVTFDDPIIKRISEAIRIIGEDIEDSYLGDQSIWEYEEDAAEAEMYLLCEGYRSNGEDRIVTVPLNVNKDGHCTYAKRWVAIPASSENQSMAYQYINCLLSIYHGTNDSSIIITYNSMSEEIRHFSSDEKSADIALPSAWQYALSDLFDEYYAGHINVDDFAKQVQGRLEIYISE